MIEIQLPRIPLLVPRSRRVVVGIDWRAVEDPDSLPSLWSLAHAYFSTAHQTTRYVHGRVISQLPARVRTVVPGPGPAGAEEASERWIGQLARRALPPVPGPRQVIGWPFSMTRRATRRLLRPLAAGSGTIA